MERPVRSARRNPGATPPRRSARAPVGHSRRLLNLLRQRGGRLAPRSELVPCNFWAEGRGSSGQACATTSRSSTPSSVTP
jgi:hypothetical protein